MTNKILPIETSPELIAYCGLYCGTCAKYKKGKCPGCRKNEKASWCKIRTCNMELVLNNCAECKQVELGDCKKLNNTIAKLFSLVFKADRLASLKYVKESGGQLFAEKMVSLNQMSIKKGQKI